MSDRTCGCCGSAVDDSAIDGSTDRDVPVEIESVPPEDRWLDHRPVLDAPLPPDVAATVEGLLGPGAGATLGDWVEAIRDVFEHPIEVADLCHAEEPMPHRATVAGETYHLQCFFDALLLARLLDERVAFRTETPRGERIEGETTPDGTFRNVPESAVASFGVATHTSGVEGRPAPAELEGPMCPYDRAFHDRASYERWARQVDAATVGLPLADVNPVVAAFVK